jgi:ketol-acid reductoisomerase
MTDRRETDVRVYRETDGTREALGGEAVAVLGYGNLGRPFVPR